MDEFDQERLKGTPFPASQADLAGLAVVVAALVLALARHCFG